MRILVCLESPGRLECFGDKKMGRPAGIWLACVVMTTASAGDQAAAVPPQPSTLPRACVNGAFGTRRGLAFPLCSSPRNARRGALRLRGGGGIDDTEVSLVRPLGRGVGTEDEAPITDFGDTSFMFPQEKKSGIPHVVRPITW